MAFVIFVELLSRQGWPRISSALDYTASAHCQQPLSSSKNHVHLRVGDATSSPFAAATRPSLSGFFFPLFQPMLGMGSNPAIPQQGFQVGGVDRVDNA
jgi:hypothetical protein